MQPSTPIHIDIIDMESASEDGTVLTPPSTITTASTYSRQHNVMPAPSREVPRPLQSGIDTIDMDSSSEHETLLTPPSTITTVSTYSRQYNVTPTPEREVPRSLGTFPGVQTALNESDAEQGIWLFSWVLLAVYSSQVAENFVSSMASLEIESNRSLEISTDDSDLVYNLRTESLPNAPIYDARLQDALRNTKQQLGQLKSIMENCPMTFDPSSTLSVLAQQTEHLSQFDYPRTRTIGLLGDSGVGEILCRYAGVRGSH
jgi:hypothetical protein